MELENIKERILKLEKNQEELKGFVDKNIAEINVGIAEIKVMLKERLEKDNLKNSLLAKDIEEHEKRIKKLEENSSWLWKTVAGSIITMIIGVITFVLKSM